MRILQKSLADRLIIRGCIIRALQKPHHRISHHRRKLTAAQNIIADRNLLGIWPTQNPLVKSFVASGNE
jgi:hypothetical protein